MKSPPADCVVLCAPELGNLALEAFTHIWLTRAHKEYTGRYVSGP